MADYLEKNSKEILEANNAEIGKVKFNYFLDINSERNLL